MTAFDRVSPGKLAFVLSLCLHGRVLPMGGGSDEHVDALCPGMWMFLCLWFGCPSPYQLFGGGGCRARELPELLKCVECTWVLLRVWPRGWEEP